MSCMYRIKSFELVNVLLEYLIYFPLKSSGSVHDRQQSSKLKMQIGMLLVRAHNIMYRMNCCAYMLEPCIYVYIHIIIPVGQCSFV